MINFTGKQTWMRFIKNLTLTYQHFLQLKMEKYLKEKLIFLEALTLIISGNTLYWSSQISLIEEMGGDIRMPRLPVRVVKGV